MILRSFLPTHHRELWRLSDRSKLVYTCINQHFPVFFSYFCVKGFFESEYIYHRHTKDKALHTKDNGQLLVAISGLLSYADIRAQMSRFCNQRIASLSREARDCKPPYRCQVGHSSSMWVVVWNAVPHSQCGEETRPSWSRVAATLNESKSSLFSLL